MTAENTRPKPEIRRAEDAVARMAAAFPDTREDNPWGHRAFKVRGKTFLFLSTDGGSLNLSVKLPTSGVLALALPFTEPTHYGLGKSGWVSAEFKPADHVPLEMIGEWLHESYAAIAPKKLAAALGAGLGERLVSAPAPAAKRKAKSDAKAEPPQRSAKAKRASSQRALKSAPKSKPVEVRKTRTARPAKASRPRKKSRPARR
jgi:predicted DNA-binding protein (MmcQ/YjbR family)